VRGGDRCWLKGRGRGEKKPVTRKIINIIIIIIIIIIISPKRRYG
jgi:hypothetical protein